MSLSPSRSLTRRLLPFIVMPAAAGIHVNRPAFWPSGQWIPACAGMTSMAVDGSVDLSHASSPLSISMSSQRNGVVQARSPARSTTVVVSDSTMAGPAICWPGVSASKS